MKANLMRKEAETTEAIQALTSAGRWKAVASRDRSADGAFVFAVKSTGVYCKPSCPARRPKPEHVTFFALPQAAERKGFRACKRCRPNQAKIQDPAVAAVGRVCLQIDEHMRNGELNGDGGNQMTLSALGRAAGVSAHQLERAFKKTMGITPRQYAESRRIGRLKSGLRKGDNVTTALYEAGYGSSSRLYERSNAHLGMTPAAYRRGGAGMQMDYAIVDSPLGRMLVAATERGVSALYLGASDARLKDALMKEYPRAEIRASAAISGGLRDWMKQVVDHLKGRQPSLDLPTDVQATAFQRLVWEELRRIPFGATRTYTQVAKSIGKPSAVRAVARACATNPVSVVVPCHRVVREDGNLAGYRWGLERKKALLEHESKA
jgi:AraC family transcriptional regulator, regulatory protein of adaptative response / methylated-DNA-[protein]-cysteine methyltransferase